MNINAALPAEGKTADQLLALLADMEHPHAVVIRGLTNDGGPNRATRRAAAKRRR